MSTSTNDKAVARPFTLPVDYTKLDRFERRAVREQYVSEQKGLCCFCQQPLTGAASSDVTAKSINKKLFPTSFFDWPVHLHHSHESGMTIGAVHSKCNAVLWQYHGE